MAANSKIEWTHHTFNPWIGCQKISPGCDHCYAETQNNHRKFNPAGWGAHASRKRTSQAYWRQPLKWDREAHAAGERRRVFCASLADVFDNHASITNEWRSDLWQMIWQTRNLDWLLLTKRPQNMAKMLPFDWGDGWQNVWLGATVENQEEADRRIPILLSTPAAVRFLSCEPLLGPLSFRWAKWDNWLNKDGESRQTVNEYDGLRMINWIICGGESGKSARPMHPDWARSLRDQCQAANVPFFFKQWGEYVDIDHLPDDIASCMDPFDIHGAAFHRIGKARAGRLLDGVTHDAFPSPQSTSPDASE